MINEIYQLSSAMEKANVRQTNWHRKYMELPKVTQKAPCVRIMLNQKHIGSLEGINAETASKIRKFGSNQGTFPAMNLIPLYRLRGSEEKKKLAAVLAGKSECPDADEIRRWCTVDNWNEKFQKRYRNSIKEGDEIAKLLHDGNVSFVPFDSLRKEMLEISKCSVLRQELEFYTFDMLKKRRDINLALQILFYPEKEFTKGEDIATTNLSVVFDSEALADSHCAVISLQFTEGLNRALMQAEETVKSVEPASERDAFGLPFTPFEEPMPRVKLAAGFDVSLRTMFGGQPCQTRYGKIENATYPISPEIRIKLQSALEWISRPDQKNVTWISIDKEMPAYRSDVADKKTPKVRDEVLFAYPVSRTVEASSYTAPFQRNRSKDGSVSFKGAAKAFISEIMNGKQPGTDPKSERIQIILLRKLDKARAKAVYSYNTTPAEIEAKAESWTAGCENLPDFFRKPESIYPLQVHIIMNQVWKRDGNAATDKFCPVQTYHGMELFFGADELTRKDLSALIICLTSLAPYFQTDFYQDQTFSWKLKEYAANALTLLGLFLYKLGHKKENYMTQFPYLLGQLLKISDSLHEMYCKVVRDGNVPPQLAGSSLYTAATEHPFRTLALLGQRMNPYIAWARSYRTKNVSTEKKESWRAGWYLSLYENAANQLAEAWNPQTKLSDEEKAALFIGYLASFPKKENTVDENGGNKNE